MSKDTLKTLAGLLLIGVLIVATFLYGDSQHQKQVRQDQSTKQSAQTTPTPTSTASKTPSAQIGMGGVTTPTPSASPLASAGSQMPQTGSADIIVPLGAMAAAITLYRRSRRQLAR